MAEQPVTMVGVDIGNTFLKFGKYSGPASPDATEPEAVMHCALDQLPDHLPAWLPAHPCAWYVSSVNREAEHGLRRWVGQHRSDRYVQLTATDVPLPIRVDFPDRVGMDRLAAAVAANALRSAGQPVIVIDAGSAITVDVVSEQGEFLGGAILPGLMMSAEALAADTDLLPLVPASYHDEPPEVLGKSTEAAMRSGLYWGTVGAVRELVTHLAQQLTAAPMLIVSGGTAALLENRLSGSCRHVPQLVLQGIALLAHSRTTRRDTRI